MRAIVNIGLIGICGYGATYVDALLDDLRGCGTTVVGVVDPAATRSPRLGELAARGCGVFPALDCLLDASPLDLLVIAAPPQFHAPMTCAALRRGANVLCEKPLAGSLADAVEVVRLRQVVEPFAAIGYQWSYSDAIQQLKRDVLAGAL